MLKELYKIRFNRQDIEQKEKIWKVLCGHFFQEFVLPESSVLDIGCGFGEFINNIRCKDKFAVDTNEDVAGFLRPDVKYFNSYASAMPFLKDNSMDIVFASNFLEHLPNKEEVIKTLQEVKRVLKPGGKIILMAPNIKYAYRQYWDFFDHTIALSDKSMVEVLLALGFNIERAIKRFLPYTTKSRLPKNAFSVWLYLKTPIVWPVMGKQFLVIARKP